MNSIQVVLQKNFWEFFFSMNKQNNKFLAFTSSRGTYLNFVYNLYVRIKYCFDQLSAKLCY